MGMRFRKSVKICKGVKINFSKSGASLSLGGKGHSVNVSSRGVRTTVGIPGTGLSYTTSAGGRSTRSSSQSRSSSVPAGTYDFKINDDGTAIFWDGKGNRIYDESLIRKLKASDSFKQQKAAILEQRKEEKKVQFQREQAAKFHEIQGETNDIVNVYQLSAKVLTKSLLEKMAEKVTAREYEMEAFNGSVPMKDGIRRSLAIEAEREVKAPFWSRKKAIAEYVESRVDNIYNEQMDTYNQAKAEFEQAEIQNAERMKKQYEEEAEQKRNEILMPLNSDPEYIEQGVEEWLSNITLTVDFSVDYFYNPDTRTMMLNLDLPPISEIPSEKAVQLASGTVKAKAKTQKEIKQEYIICVFGLAVCVSSHIFNISTAIENIIVAGYADRRDDRTGSVVNECIYSVKFPRSDFENTDLTKIDPQQFCLSLESRANITASLIMKSVEPLAE